MARQPWGGRPNKAALLRMKWVTALVSAVAFAGSLGAIAYINPGGRSAATTAGPVQTISLVSPANAPAQIANSSRVSRQRQASAVPITRTRGS